MRIATLAVVLVTGLLLAACTGSSAPLTLEQRVVGADEAPGSEADPEETPATVTELEDVGSILEGAQVYEEDVAELEEAGFVALTTATRFFPSEEGGEHAPGTRHVYTNVAQFDSADGANDALVVAHRIGLRPCPETCAYVITEFEPSGIGGAKGVQAIATQESIDRIGDDSIQPDARYSVYFADGPFVYEVTTFGPPDEVTKEQVEEFAGKLYERVKGAPLPEPS